MTTQSIRMCPILGVRDVRAAVALFSDALGFTVRDVLDDGGSTEGAVYGIVERDGAEIHLQIRRRNIWSGERAPIENDVYVRVANVDSLYEEFSARGAKIVRAPMDEPYGMRDFVVAGPEHYRLVFGSPLT